MKPEKADLLPAGNLLFKLTRIVSYKIRELNILGSPRLAENSWYLVEKLFNRENHYAAKAGFSAPASPYEKAMWSYYELLEQISLRELEELRKNVLSQIKTSEMKRKIIL